MAKATSKGFWAWLKVKSNRTVLAWIGGGLIVIAGGAWRAYLHFEEQAQKRQTSIATPGDKSKKTDQVQESAKDDTNLSTGAQIQQKAEARDGGVAINAGRDVNINK